MSAKALTEMNLGYTASCAPYGHLLPLESIKVLLEYLKALIVIEVVG